MKPTQAELNRAVQNNANAARNVSNLIRSGASASDVLKKMKQEKEAMTHAR